MSYSHRDHRALRELWTGAGAFLTATLVLIALALAFPSGAAPLVVLGALAGAGAIFLGWADWLTDTYAGDLARVREGADAPSRLRAEVGSDIGFDRERYDRGHPSPHHRGRAPEGPLDLPRRQDGRRPGP